MSDLISRNALIKEIETLKVHVTGLRAGKVLSEFEKQYKESIIRVIEEQPTTYDIEKVVEQLEEQAVKEVICEIKHSSIPRQSQKILLNLVGNHLVVKTTAARLTKVIEGEITYAEERNLKCNTYCSKCLQGAGNCKTLRNMLYKLAECENAGVTPEVIQEFDMLYLEKCQEINGLHNQLEEVKKQLPSCAVGDMVYLISDEKVSALLIKEITSIQNETELSYFYNSGKFQFCDYDIGRNIYLSEEEAKEALQKEEMK